MAHMVLYVHRDHIHVLWSWSRLDSFCYPEATCTEEVGIEPACMQSHNQIIQ